MFITSCKTGLCNVRGSILLHNLEITYFVIVQKKPKNLTFHILLLHVVVVSSFVFVAFYGCVHHSKSSHILDSYLTLGIWQDGDNMIRIFRLAIPQFLAKFRQYRNHMSLAQLIFFVM